MEPEKSSNDDQIFGESEGESGTNNGSKHPTNELGLFTVPADNEDQSSQFGNINLNLSIDTKKTQVSKDIDCGANTEEEIDKIDNSNQKIKLNENNQNKSLNDNKNAIISTSPLETNTDNNIQPLDKINNNQDQKKTKSESQNPENSTIDKVDYKNIDSNSTIKTADNIIGHQKDQSKIINNPPIGLPNPSSYCYLNSILQTLFSCQQFREEIIEIYQNNKSTNCDNENKEFVVSLGNLFFQMKEGNENEAKNAVKELHKHFDRTIYGDDIHICYLQILTKINDEIKIIQESDLDSTINNLADKQFSDYRQKNYGLIFDLFCGQISFKQKCKNCSKEFNEKFQLFKTMPLQIPLTNSKIKECIECFFEESRIDGSICEDCKADLFSFSEITHSPQFIFIYLVRGAYSLSENKNNTFIKYDNYINIPTLKGNVLYKLRSVIDHLDGNESGHYFVKTLSGPDWYLLNDVQVRKINSTEVVTKHSIGLLIEKVTNFDENILDIPEPLIDYDTKCFYQNGFQSILQIFYLCCDIRQYFIDIYTSKITNENNTQELNFIETLGQIFYYIRNMNEQEIINAVKNLYEMFGNSLEKNDIYKCYFEILNKMNDAIKSPIENHSEPNYSNKISADEQFLFYKNQNNGIIFDNFFGQILFVTKCENKECNKVFHEKYQLFSILPLQIKSRNQNTPISECIESYFEKSKLEGSNYQCCDKQDIISISHCTHSPHFLFIYLVPEKYDTKFIEFDNYINIPNVNGNVLYKLRFVIDRSNYDNAFGGYLVKMLINSNWWLKKDYRVKYINPKEVPTKYSIGLLIEKVTNVYHNVPETLLFINRNQELLQSIIQMLYLCVDVRQCLIEFYTNYHSNENISENLIFKIKIGEMMVLLDKNETDKIKTLWKEILNFLPNKIQNIDQLYYLILAKLNDPTININEDPKQQSAIAEPDLFGDDISIKLECILCEQIFCEGIRTFKSITINEPTAQQKPTISKCIENVLKNSEKNECNDKQQIISINQLTNSPQFIFIYLVRKSNKFIEFNNYINVPTVNGNVLYKLRYVIDQIGDNEYRRFVVKTLTGSNWLEKDYYHSKMLHRTNVPTQNSIGFLIEKVTNINHNVPETLLHDNYSFQESLQSIIQMLYLCVDIRQCLIEFYTNYNSNENITENLIFKKKIGEIMYFLNNENKSDQMKCLFKEATNFLPNKIINIYELYLCVVDKLNEKGTQSNSNVEFKDSLDESGYKRSRIHCENCTNYSMKISQPEIFKSLYLDSQINKCCNNPKIVNVEEILSSPKYLFIYLDRFEGNVEDNKEFILNTQSGTRRYFLLSLLNYTIIKYYNGQPIGQFSVRKFESKSIRKPNNESIIAVMMEREDENISISNTENDNKCGIDMKTKDSFDSTSNVNDNLINQHISLHKNDYHSNISNTIAEEKLESDFIAQSIKQIIELNKDNKIHVLLGLLFSCTSFRNFMISLYNNYQIKKVFEKFALIDIGIFVNNVCILYDQVIGQKRITSINKSDNNWNINQCFDFIFGSIKMITESKEFSKIIDSRKCFNSKFIIDNFFGIILLEIICNNCSKTSKYEDSFSNLCVKKPQKGSLISLDKCLINYLFEGDYQQEEKCCKNPKFTFIRKIINAPPILFICFDEKTRNINQNCDVYCGSKLTIDTTNGPVTYSLVSLIDRNAQKNYEVKFLGNSDWWQTYPKPRKINISELFTKFTVGFLFKKLE